MPDHAKAHSKKVVRIRDAVGKGMEKPSMIAPHPAAVEVVTGARSAAEMFGTPAIDRIGGKK